MRCTIWYYLYYLKNVKSTYGRVLLLLKLQVEAWWIDFAECWPTKGVYALFPAETIVGDSQHCKSPTRPEQHLRRLGEFQYGKK